MWSPRSLLFTLCITVSFVTGAGALISVYGYEGKDVHVPCSYGAGYESYVKYFCKNDCYDDNDIVVKTQVNKAKYSIHDDKTRRVFTVTISDLSQTDAGKYWCVVERNGKDWYTEVKLEVSEDTCCDKSTKVQTHEDASVSFTCPYESKDENNLKYICRGNQSSVCLQQALVNSTSLQNGRFRLTDDKTSRRFTVTITNLTQGDTGSYLCGAHRDPGLDVFTAVDLDVKEWCCVTTKKLSGTVGRPVTLQCPYPPGHKHNRKFLCKGDHRKSCTDMVTSQSRFTLQDDVSSSSFLVMVTELQAGDAGTYWCGSDSQWSAGQYTKIQLSVVGPQLSSTVIPLATTEELTITEIKDAPPTLTVVFTISAVLLILTVALIIVCTYKCHKVQGARNNMNMNMNTDMDIIRHKTTGLEAEEVMGGEDVYANHDIVANSKRGTSYSHYDDAGDDSMYQNFSTADDIYCNQVYVTAKR